MPPPSAKTMTLQGVMEFISNDEKLTPAQRAERISGMRTLARVSRKHPSEILADPQVIRALVDRASWQLAGLSKQRWANVLSLVTSAMKLAGIKVRRRRRNRKLDAEWEALLAPLTRRDRDELHPFAGWCSALGIAPSEVDAVVFRRYLDHLEQETIQRNPRERWHVARRAWNRCFAFGFGSPYPAIQNVEPDGWRGLPWDAFPPSLLAEIEAYKVAAVEVDPFAEEDRRKAIKPITLNGYVNNVRWYLSVLVKNGVPVDQFTSLIACLDPVLVKRALTLRLGGRDLDDKTRPGLSAMMTAIVSVARHVEVSAEILHELRRLAKRVQHRPEAMCEKNRVRLGQFADEKALQALINLPFGMAQRLAHVKQPTVREAQEMQSAALLGLLTFLPLRIMNAAALDLDKHFLQTRGQGGRWLVHFEPEEVKNKTAIDGCLNERLSAMLARYVDVFRPVLLKSPTSKLFVGQNGKAKDPHTLGRQFYNLIKRSLGLHVNAHLMRHLAGFIYLKANPGHYEAVRQMLGHKNIATTIKFYAGADTEAAFERYDEIISARISPIFAGGARNARRRLFEASEVL